MQNFLSIDSHTDPVQLLERALARKRDPLALRDFGDGQTLGLIFMNPSLRARMSTQKAATNLGMNGIALNAGGAESWKIETEPGVVMDGEKQEHIVDAARVISSYCDIVGLRTFASLEDRATDLADPILHAFADASSVPVVNMESAAGHPLQGLADMMTIHERCEEKSIERPRVVLSWAPHPRALPQAVPNSFAAWSRAMDYDLVITHPEGYDLDERFTEGATIEPDRDTAFDGADIVYAKNWSATEPYGEVLTRDPSWTVDTDAMSRTREAIFLHCLPVRRNVVVTDAVIDAPTSRVVAQAKNREYAAQAVLAELLMQGVEESP